MATGAHALAGGAGALADGAGAHTLAEGAGALAEGAGALATGARALAEGAGALAEGAGALAEGAGALAEGAGALAADEDGLAGGFKVHWLQVQVDRLEERCTGCRCTTVMSCLSIEELLYLHVYIATVLRSLNSLTFREGTLNYLQSYPHLSDTVGSVCLN